MNNALSHLGSKANIAALCAMSLFASGCASLAVETTPQGVAVTSQYPVTSNETPYSRCLAVFAQAPGAHLPSIAIGEVADRTGQFDVSDHGHALSQGATEMVISAFYRTGKVHLIERSDLRVANQDFIFRQNGLIGESLTRNAVRGADFIVLGALTELNYNIVSDGAGLWVRGVGGGVKRAVVNVALDLRVVNARTLDVVYATSLQKQIVGSEVEANVFRFFDANLVELDAGRIRNEPLQLGVRSVAEMAVHQIMTEYFGLEPDPDCRLRVDGIADSQPSPTR